MATNDEVLIAKGFAQANKEAPMRWHSLSSGEWLRAVLVGLGVSLLTAAVMVTLLKTGVSPLPKPLGLAFAQAVLHRAVPLPVGSPFMLRGSPHGR